jgi:transcriptional regulator with XRE-family HTH domain
MDIYKRVQQIIEHYQLSPSDFADKIGIQRSGVSHLTSGRNKPSVDFIEKLIHSFPEININWFVAGIGEMITKNENLKLEPPKEETSSSSTLLLFPEFEQKIENQKNQEKTKSKEEKIIIAENPIFEKNLTKTSNIEKSEVLKSVKKVKRMILIYDDNTFEYLENS